MIARKPDAIEKMVEGDPPPLNNEHFAQLAKVFKLLGDETRLRIVLHVSRTEMNVRQLCDLLHLSQPLVSTHIGLLREAGVLQMRHEGKCNFYSLRRQHLARLMDALAIAQPAHPRCDCFLECLVGGGAKD